MPSTNSEQKSLQPYFLDREKFMALYIFTHPNINRAELDDRLRSALGAWGHGLTCDCCGKPMWIVGTAIYGWRGCYTCMEGPNSRPFLELSDGSKPDGEAACDLNLLRNLNSALM